MTKAKTKGGFGFRELHAFNSTLLANMAVRVLSEPNSLWVKVMKDLYFPLNDFLNAKKGGRSSWGWSSLLVGRDVLLHEGVCLLVMDDQLVILSIVGFHQ